LSEVIVYNDAHFPYHDRKVLNDILYIIKQRQPEKVILNGDMMDCYSVSRFDKNPYRMFHVGSRGTIVSALQNEIDLLRNHLRELRKVAPDSEIVYNEGNHEYRLTRYVFSKAAELSGLRRSDSEYDLLSLPYLLEFDKLDVKFNTSPTGEGWEKVGNIIVGHFNRVNKHSAYTAKNLLDDKGVSLVQGHTHRGGSSYKSTLLGSLQSHENFCTCMVGGAEYTSNPNWQQGMGIIEDGKWYRGVPYEDGFPSSLTS
jgi:UDP-2,3-diacylglucosamine pyrophosphatase LpxH